MVHLYKIVVFVAVSSFYHILTDGAIGRNSQAFQLDYEEIQQNNVDTQAVMENELDNEQNVMVPIQEPNLQLVTALPVKLKDILEKVRSVQPISFLNDFRPGQVNIQLTRPQTEIYRKYLIDTGLIKLKPYRQIFSQILGLELPSLNWMVINFELNPKSCLTLCKTLVKRNTLFDVFGPKPVRLLVPALQVRKGLKDTVEGTKTIIGGLQDISGGMFRMVYEGINTAKDLTISAAGNLSNNEISKSGKSDKIHNVDNESEKTSS